MDITEQLAALRQKFIGDLPTRMNAIKLSFEQWRDTDSADSLKEFHRLAHSLTGAAATFECAEVSANARTLEVQLKTLSAEDISVHDADLDQLFKLLAEVDAAVDRTTA